MALAPSILAVWSAALPVKLIKAEGDVLTLEVQRGSWDSTIQIDLSCSGAYTAYLHDSGVISESIQTLLKSDDIEFLLDRYSVQLDAESRQPYVWSRGAEHFAWRVYELYLFVQAVADYQTGIESAQFQKLVAQ